MNYKLNCPAWYKPYAEILFEADFDRLLRILAAGTEAAGFQRHWDQLLTEPHRACSAPELCPGVQLGREARRSENIESCKTPASEEL